MSYEYDIFISYRRNDQTLRWIKDFFVPALELHVEHELERRPLIYVDVNKIDVGTSWPVELGVALGKSRVLIVLWSANYFRSDWCRREFSHMLAREREANLRTREKPHGVIIPAFIHDGERFPPDLGYIEHFEIQKYFNVRMPPICSLAAELDARVTEQAPAITKCIVGAPDWQEAWPQQAVEDFVNQFYQEAEVVQRTVPRFTAP
jgi:TIR domain